MFERDNEYLKWITDISKNYKHFQIKAALNVNAEMLKFYFFIGEGIYNLSKKNVYGNKLLENFSKDLKQKLPSMSGLSITNIGYMKRFYETFSDIEIYPQLGGESSSELIYPQIGGESLNAENIVFLTPWGHIKYLLDKCSGDKDKILFFMRKINEFHWSRAVLLNFLDTDLYEREGKAVTNFKWTLPKDDSDLAQEITKDPYNFDFIAIRKDYDERELKDNLINNIEKFLLELGSGFAFVGREYRLQVGETEQFIDLLFYNINLHCYVVIEVKVQEFKPDMIGQLGTYVVAVDQLLKKDEDKKTIGILICKTKDNILAKFALESSAEPLGVSEYELSNYLPEDYKSNMPTIEEIEKGISEL